MLFLDNCGGLGTLVKLIKLVLERGVILIGVVLVILIIIDLAKAIISGDEKEVKSAQKAAIRRGIYALVLFFVPTIVTVVMNLLSAVGITSEYKKCIDNATKEKIEYYQNIYDNQQGTGKGGTTTNENGYSHNNGKI